MTDDIESYWKDIKVPREGAQEKSPSKSWLQEELDLEASRRKSVCDHIDPTKIEGWRISEEALYLLEEPVDGATASDYQGERCVVFKPPWYKFHRWIWWLFITGGFLSPYEWTLTVIDLKVHKAYRRRREWPG